MIYEKRPDSGGTWAPPGGHLELGEEFLDCVKREAKEEVNIDVLEAELWQVYNTIAGPNWHYVNIDFLVTKWVGAPKIMEPMKCEKLEWFNLNNLPSPLLPAPQNFFKHNPPCLCRSGKKYLECHGS